MINWCLKSTSYVNCDFIQTCHYIWSQKVWLLLYDIICSLSCTTFMKLSLPLSILNQRNLNVHDQTISSFLANVIFTKTSVKCTDCLTLWSLYIWNSNTFNVSLFLKLSSSCNKYFPLKLMNYLWSVCWSHLCAVQIGFRL